MVGGVNGVSGGCDVVVVVGVAVVAVVSLLSALHSLLMVCAKNNVNVMFSSIVSSSPSSMSPT